MSVNETAYQRIKHWTISDLREYVLNDEVTATISPLSAKADLRGGGWGGQDCSNADLIYGGKNAGDQKANTTIGLPGP